MIEIDGVELRTAAQWEKKHRHVKKGQLGKGVERTWRSPNGNTTAMFYNIEQTRPWAKKDVEAVNRRRRADAKAKREAEERERSEVADFELSEFFNRIASAEGKAWVLSVERVGDVGDSALVEPDGDELVSQLGKRRWRVMGDPEDGWWVEVDSDGNELPGDWEYDRKGGYVYCAFA